MVTAAESHGDPEFVQAVQNITVPVGRDVKFSCHVRHLGNYKVRTTTTSHLHFSPPPPLIPSLLFGPKKGTKRRRLLILTGSCDTPLQQLPPLASPWIVVTISFDITSWKSATSPLCSTVNHNWIRRRNSVSELMVSDATYSNQHLTSSQIRLQFLERRVHFFLCLLKMSLSVFCLFVCLFFLSFCKWHFVKWPWWGRHLKKSPPNADRQ